MSASPVTRPSLLVRIRDPQDREAWNRFVELYTPLIYGYCRRRALQDADAVDVAQEVLRAVASSIPHFDYDRGQGTFRGWLHRVTWSKLCTFYAKRQRHAQGTGDTGVHQMLAALPDRDEALEWDREYDRRVYEWAVEQVRGDFRVRSWQAFWQTAVEAKPAQDVAKALGLTVGAVYIAKSRVIARLRDRIITWPMNGDECKEAN